MAANFQNLNDQTPAAPSGRQNVKWQVDSSTPRNDSAYVPSTGGAAVKTGNYQIQESDCGTIVVFEGSANATFELPAIVPFESWCVFIQNNSSISGSPPVTPVLTLTPLSGSPPSGPNLDGSSASITLQPGQGIYIASDGTNYFTERGMGSGASIIFETNGTDNADQTLLNLEAGTNVTLVNSGGAVTISASTPAGGGNSMWQLTPPALSAFSWMNQGGASSASGTNFLALLAPASSSTELRILHQPAPTAPWDLYALVIVSGHTGGALFGGLEVDDGTKVAIICVTLDGGSSSIQTADYNSVTNVNTSLNSDGIGSGVFGPVWFHINNTAGALTMSYSFDGVGWTTLTSGFSGFLSAVSNVGIFANSQNGSFPVSTTVLSFAFGSLVAN